MLGHYCYTIWDEVAEATIPGEFEFVHDALKRIQDLEEYYNHPDRFKLEYSYCYDLED